MARNYVARGGLTSIIRVSDRNRKLQALLNRDGPRCFFCGLKMEKREATIEHLVPRSQGGNHGMANLALAHSRCNTLAADMSLAEKIAMRDQMREKLPRCFRDDIARERDR